MQKNQSVKVAIRIRPLNKRQKELNSPICVQSNQNTLRIQKQSDTKQFIFDYVFEIDSAQEAIYEDSAFRVVESAIQGYNATIFAYGQTGAGKTFTMIGDYLHPEVKGVIPRAFDHVIQSIQTMDNRRYVVRLSFIQIYNEDIIDLLEQKTKNNSGSNSAKKDIHQHINKGIYIKDLKMVPVKTVEEMFKVLDFGNKNRTAFATAMNAVSSRSHAILTVHIESLEGEDKVRSSKMNLVDLAGSERQSKTQATGDRLKEGAKINLSLTALGNVINALVDGRKGGHIPFRDSKLTRLLQDSLGGNTKTLMIASVSPAADNYEETLSTIRYAARARNIKNTPKINEDPKDTMIREYLQQIQRLKRQLQNQLLSNPDEPEFVNIIKTAQDEAERKAREEVSKQMQQMQQKLKEMQELVLRKQQVPPETEKARRLRKKKVMKQEQLIEQRLQDLQRRQQDLLDESRQAQQDSNIEKHPLQLRCQYWKSIALRLRQKLKSVVKDKDDREREFQVEREDLNVTIRNLESELSLFKQLAEKFLTPEQVASLRQSSEYDEEKRHYTLPAFLMKEGAVSLPKSLNPNQIEDLWQEKRSNVKLQILSHSHNLEVQKMPEMSRKYTEASGNPFLQNRRLFQITDYRDPRYQEKTHDFVDRNVFLRTNFRFNNKSSRSRSRSRTGSRGGKYVISCEKKDKKKQPSREKVKLEPLPKKF